VEPPFGLILGDIFMKIINTLHRLINKAENLERKIAWDIKKRGTTPIETYKNRCLMYAERVNDLTNVSEEAKQAAKRRIFNVYFRLQDYAGSESITPDREEYLEELLPELDMAIVEAYSSNSRTGGMGFSSTTNMMLVEGLKAAKNPYWLASNAAKTQAPEYDGKYVYKPKQTMVQWKVEMKDQKREMLNERQVHGLQCTRNAANADAAVLPALGRALQQRPTN